MAAPMPRRSGQVHIGVDLAQERHEFAAPVPGVQRSGDRAAGNVERSVQAGVPLRHDDRGRGGELPASTARSRRSIVNDMLTTELLSIRNRIRELRREKAPRGRRRSRQRNRHSQTPRWRSSGWRLSSTKGRHSTCDGRSSAYSSRRVVCGSVTGCDPQAPSTLWIVIIRQRWRNSMLHSASCLGLVLLVIQRWYMILSALGNHHTNQTRRNDRHNRHRRGPAAPTASRPPRTLTPPEVGAQPTRSRRQARVGEPLRMPGIPMRLDGDGTPESGYCSCR
jgi:hypothetical protein